MKDKSGIFAIYNRLANLHDPRIDKARLNRALGIAMSSHYPDKYYTTMETCSCPDHTNRGTQFICKHRLAMLMVNPVEAGVKIFEETL